jgi:transcriptional regulator with XRE-family HTH domain
LNSCLIIHDSGYEEFKIGLMIKELRLKEGMTQEELAKRMNTKKSVISRMENHAEDMRCSFLRTIGILFKRPCI